MKEDNDSAIQIPEIFYSYDTGSPFEHCIDCHVNLRDGQTEYFIEKAVKTYKGYSAEDVIFEYAICLACAERVRKQMSEASMQSIQDYFASEVNIIDRMHLMQANPENPDAWMSQCLIKGTPTDELEEYQIYAHCKGDKLITTQMPYMISGQALDEIANLLSNETLDELDNFMNQHFGPPPELMEPLPSGRKVILI
ncbi:MAG: hypothetical protein R3345_05485 [Fulvivirga sp.]|nr:hypothetical protein [Fulvivirga sp.]